jgi:hypothetical protein
LGITARAKRCRPEFMEQSASNYGFNLFHCCRRSGQSPPSPFFPNATSRVFIRTDPAQSAGPKRKTATFPRERDGQAKSFRFWAIPPSLELAVLREGVSRTGGSVGPTWTHKCNQQSGLIANRGRGVSSTKARAWAITPGTSRSRQRDDNTRDGRIGSEGAGLRPSGS